MRAAIVYIIAAAMYSGLNFYIARKLYTGLRYLFNKLNPVIFGIVYAVFSLPTILSFAISNLSYSSFTKSISIISNYWMGLFLYLLLFFIISDLILLICKLTKLLPKPIPKKTVFITACIVLTLTVGFFSFGVYNASRISNVSYEVKIDKETSIDSLKIALISDLHLGYVYDEKYLERVVDSVNSLEPDVIFITGDIFDGSFSALSNPSEIKNQFNRLSSKYGTYACFGNHDAGSSYDEMTDLINSTDIKLLNDEFVNIDNKFILIGRRDSSPIGGRGKTERIDINYDNIDKSLPIIVLDHQPSNYPEYPENVDLVLCGHTHRGQIIPLNFITSIYHIEDYGHYQESPGKPQMIVTSGIGTWGPRLRSGSNNEVVSILVTFK